MLFGAVALTGVLASVGMQTLTGPVTSITRVTQKNVADNNLLMNAKIIVNAAVTGVSGGDVDADGIIEPAPFAPAGGEETPPANGGYLPTNLGLALTDPWGSKFGYCVWDHGSTNTSANRITGDNTAGAATQPVIAVVAAGADKVFQTTCSAYAGGTVTAAKTGGSDDLILKYTYAEATASSNGLWTLNTSNQAKAELKDSGGTANVSINRSTGVGDFLGIITSTIDSKLGEVINIGGALRLDTAGASVDTCNAATKGALRLNATETALELCDGAGAWGPANALPAGSVGQVQFNNGSGSFGADASLYWDNAAKRLGVGTATPALRLHVSDGAQFYGVTAGASPSGVDYAYPYETVGVAPGMNLRLQSPVSIVFHTGMTASEPDDNSKARMIIGPTGNVGIGTASPGRLLHLSGTDGVLRIDRESSDGGSIYLNRTISGVLQGGFVMSGSETAYRLLHDIDSAGPNTELLRVTSTGNVGIGTITPSSLLTVGGGGAVDKGVTISASDGAYLELYRPAQSHWRLRHLGNGLGIQNSYNSGTYNNAIVLEDGLGISTAETMRLAYSGGAYRVGIGTSTPQSKLDVAGGVKVGADAVCNASKAGLIAWNTSQLQICDGTSFQNVRSVAKLDDVGDVYLTETGNAEPGNNEILAWNATDNRWEAKNINVVGSAIATPGGADKQVQFNDGGALAGASQLYWDKINHRLGIGTATPETRLNIVGDSTTGANVSIAKYEGGTPGLVFRSAEGTAASPTATVAGRQLGAIAAYGYNGSAFTSTPSAAVRFVTEEAFTTTANGTSVVFETTPNGSATTARAERMRITNNGNVGIATASPGYKLDVAGDANFSDRGGFGIVPASSGAQLGVSPATSTRDGIMVFASDPSYSGDMIEARYGATPLTGNLLKLAIGNGADTKFIVTGAGSVGIGTAIPNASALLDVSSVSKGFLPPRMTSAQRDAISSPAAGLTIYNTTGNALNVFNGTAWVSPGPGGSGTQVAFLAHKNGVSQTGIASASVTQVTFLTEAFDTNNNFNTATSRFTPTVAGNYVLTANVGWPAPSAGNFWIASIRKNGSAVAQNLGHASNGGGFSAPVTTIVYANGTSDYFDVTVYHGTGSSQSVEGSAASTYFGGVFMGGGSGGGSATAAGSVAGAIQFNDGADAFASDDANLVWDNVNKRLGIGTASPAGTLDVNGSIKQSGVSIGGISGVPTFNAAQAYTTTGYPNNGSRFVFPTASVNVASAYNASTGIFTAPIAGYYQFTYMVAVGINATHSVNDVGFAKNGTAGSETLSAFTTCATDSTAMSWCSAANSAIYQMVVGDTMQVVRSCCDNTQPLSWRANFAGAYLHP